MKCVASIVCLSVFLVVVNAAPAPQFDGTSLQASAQGGSTPAQSPIGGISNILQNIDLPGLLRGINSFVGLVRQFCPPLSQILDNVIQNVTSQAFRIFGRAILQSGGLGGGARGGGTQKVNVVLPTFPPDDDYDDEEEAVTEPTVDVVSKSGNIQESTTAVFTSSPEMVVDSNTISNDVSKARKRSVPKNLA